MYKIVFVSGRKAWEICYIVVAEHGVKDKSDCFPIMFCNSYHTRGNPLIGGNPN